MLTAAGSAPMREFDVATGLLPWSTSGPFGVGRHPQRADHRVFRAGFDRRGRRSFHHYFRAARDPQVWAEVEASVAALRTRPLLTVFGQHNDPLGKSPQRLRLRAPHPHVDPNTALDRP